MYKSKSSLLRNRFALMFLVFALLLCSCSAKDNSEDGANALLGTGLNAASDDGASDEQKTGDTGDSVGEQNQLRGEIAAANPPPVTAKPLISTNGAVPAFKESEPETDIKAIFQSFGTKEELKEKIKSLTSFYNNAKDGGYRTEVDMVEEEAAFDTAASAPMADTNAAVSENSAGGESGYSATNEQVAGIAEADVIKTDGQFIYAMNYQKIAIIDPDSLAVKSIIKADKNAYMSEMYLVGDYLVVVGSKSNNYPIMPRVPYAINDEMKIDGNGGYYASYTVFWVYDINDRAKPKLQREVDIEGYNVSTRMSGNLLYFVTNMSVYYEADYIPKTADSLDGGIVREMEVADIYCFPYTKSAQYLIIGAFDITKQEEVETQAFLGSGSTLYQSASAMYITSYEWTENGQVSQICKFKTNDGDIRFSAAVDFKGYVINQYAMDEYDGNFRVAVTDWQGGNAVYIYDSSMKPMGSVTDIAPDETIQSVRFNGKTAYVVTYLQTDPLFVIDLSDPDNPVITGELKVPGFSTYMHMLGDGYVLGLGRHTTELYYRDEEGNEVTVGVRDVGMKATLFDVTDPAAPKEIATKIIGDSGTWSNALYNPKALMVDREKGYFAFPINYSKSGEWWNGGMVLSVDSETGIEIAANIKLDYSYDGRFCYIGNRLYFVDINNGSLYMYDYDSFAKLREAREIFGPEYDYGNVKPYAIVE